MTILTVEDTVQTYSGRPGCMCGCLGTYNKGERARKRAITQMLKGDFEIQKFHNVSDGAGGCIIVETPTRNRVLYLTEDGIDAVIAAFPSRPVIY